MDFIRLYEDINLENEIKIMEQNQEFSNFVGKNNSFEYYYFLYHLRHNLFNWYPFKKEGNLLEIGSGYGQLTSLFTQKVNNVAVVEDSQTKADLISDKFGNVNVLLSDFNKLDIDDKFDYIILCNTFEYAKSFMDCENPYVDYLNYLKTFLKEDGVILIALSNRLGLKYFAGFKEEHTNQFFAGIDGYVNENNVETFTKPELINIIEKSGFHNYKFFYPYPDHEFPKVISTDEFVNKIPYTEKPIYFKQRSYLFNEDGLNQNLAKDNMADYFANSFLVEIRNSDKKYETDNINFVKINSERKPEFQTTTIIYSDTVSKYPISNNALNHVKKMSEESESRFGKIKYLKCDCAKGCSYEYLQVNSLKDLINDAINENDTNRFFNLIQDYYEALLFNSYETDSYASDNFLSIFKRKSKEKFHCHVKSNIDMDFSNIFIIDDEYVAVDYEWVFNFPIPIEYIFYRTIKQNIESNPLFNKFTSFTDIFKYFNLNMADIGLFEVWDKNLFKFIHGNIPVNDHKVIPKENLDYVENIDEYVDLVLDSKDINCHNFDLLKRDIVLNQRRIINQKNKEIKKKNKQIRKKNKKLKEMRNSTSWRITEPLRKLRSIFK